MFIPIKYFLYDSQEEKLYNGGFGRIIVAGAQVEFGDKSKLLQFKT